MISFLQAERANYRYPPTLELLSEDSVWAASASDASHLEQLLRVRAAPSLAHDRNTPEQWDYALDFVVGPCSAWAQSSGMDVKRDLPDGQAVPTPGTQASAWVAMLMLFACHCTPEVATKHLERSVAAYSAHRAVQIAMEHEQVLHQTFVTLENKPAVLAAIVNADADALGGGGGTFLQVLVHPFAAWQHAAHEGAAYRKLLNAGDRKALATILCGRTSPEHPSYCFTMDMLRQFNFEGGIVPGGAENKAAVKALYQGMRPAFVQRVVLESFAQRMLASLGSTGGSAAGILASMQ